MRILITGGAGQLGRALARAAEARGLEAVGLDLPEFDVCDPAAVRAALAEYRPAWVLHCAAATHVDRCESEVEWAEAVNARAPGTVAEACAERETALVHYSTDFVFDGLKGEPYVETDAVCPLSVYGRTKADGEAAVRGGSLERWLILRTQWLYGPGGRCFPAGILDQARSGQPLRVVDDQVGSPTMTDDLAAATLDLVAKGRGEPEPGVYHAANRGIMSWFDFARLVLRRAGQGEVAVERIGSDALRLPAPRPRYSALDTTKLERALGRPLPGVEDALVRYLRAEGLLVEEER